MTRVPLAAARIATDTHVQRWIDFVPASLQPDVGASPFLIRYAILGPAGAVDWTFRTGLYLVRDWQPPLVGKLSARGDARNSSEALYGVECRHGWGGDDLCWHSPIKPDADSWGVECSILGGVCYSSSTGTRYASAKFLADPNSIWDMLYTEYLRMFGEGPFVDYTI